MTSTLWLNTSLEIAPSAETILASFSTSLQKVTESIPSTAFTLCVVISLKAGD